MAWKDMISEKKLLDQEGRVWEPGSIFQELDNSQYCPKAVPKGQQAMCVK